MTAIDTAPLSGASASAPTLVRLSGDSDSTGRRSMVRGRVSRKAPA
jgi:hypothetical protein